MRSLCEFMRSLYTKPQAFRAKFISHLSVSFIHGLSEFLSFASPHDWTRIQSHTLEPLHVRFGVSSPSPARRRGYPR